jgi:hypothetical protein
MTSCSWRCSTRRGGGGSSGSAFLNCGGLRGTAGFGGFGGCGGRGRGWRELRGEAGFGGGGGARVLFGDGGNGGRIRPRPGGGVSSACAWHLPRRIGVRDRSAGAGTVTRAAPTGGLRALGASGAVGVGGGGGGNCGRTAGFGGRGRFGGGGAGPCGRVDRPAPGGAGNDGLDCRSARSDHAGIRNRRSTGELHWERRVANS